MSEPTVTRIQVGGGRPYEVLVGRDLLATRPPLSAGRGHTQAGAASERPHPISGRSVRLA